MSLIEPARHARLILTRFLESSYYPFGVVDLSHFIRCSPNASTSTGTNPTDIQEALVSCLCSYWRVIRPSTVLSLWLTHRSRGSSLVTAKQETWWPTPDWRRLSTGFEKHLLGLPGHASLYVWTSDDFRELTSVPHSSHRKS
jgi:hypothetical protein